MAVAGGEDHDHAGLDGRKDLRFERHQAVGQLRRRFVACRPQVVSHADGDDSRPVPHGFLKTFEDARTRLGRGIIVHLDTDEGHIRRHREDIGGFTGAVTIGISFRLEAPGARTTDERERNRLNQLWR